MIGWPENAFVGQKVVCLRTSDIACGPHGETLPVYRGIYTIRDIIPFNGICFRLMEIVNPVLRYRMNGALTYDEGVFNSRFFRPVQTRDTSAQVEALKRLTLGVHDEVRA